MTLFELLKELEPKRADSELKTIHTIFSELVPKQSLKDIHPSIVMKLRKFKKLMAAAGIR